MRDLEDLTIGLGPVTVAKPDKDGNVAVTVVCEAIVTQEKLDALGFPLPVLPEGDFAAAIKKIVTTGCLGKGGSDAARITLRDDLGHPLEFDVDVSGMDFVMKDGLPYLVAKLQTRRDVVVLDKLAALVGEPCTMDLVWTQRELDFTVDDERRAGRGGRRKRQRGPMMPAPSGVQ